MGSVRKRGDKWYIDYYNSDGKRIVKVAGNTKKQAEKILTQLEANKYDNKFGIKSFEQCDTTELFNLFIKLKQGEVRLSSLRKYENHLKFWITKHPRKFTPLSIVEIETYLQELKSEDLSNATINSYLTTLKQLYNYAEKRKFLQDNTAKQVRRLKKKPRKPPRYFTDNEIERILSYNTPYRDAFIILLYTGIRKSALIFLEWENIDFENKVIKIRNKEGFTTKSGKNRTIPMHPKVEGILRKRREKTGYIFSYSTGNPHHRNKWNDSLRRILKKENIQHASIHTFRHTFATRFLESGGSLRQLQEILGHANIETTMIYAHLVPEHVRNAINRLK
jgi:integrase